MKKLVTCKTCGAQIAKTAKVCPSCGAKQHKGAHIAAGIVGVLAVVLIIAVIGSALGGSNEPTLVTSGGPVSEGAANETPSAFGVGQTASLNDVNVMLTNVTESAGSEYIKPGDGKVFVLCEFEIANNSDSDIGVSSLVSFEAYVDEYSTSLSLSALAANSDQTQLDGTVAAGKKMKGIVGYEANADWKNIEVKFTPDFWAGSDITFTYSK